MTYGYESRLSALGISRIQEYARGFRNEVEKVRRTAEVSRHVLQLCEMGLMAKLRQELERPLIIIGHSYGGLLIAHVSL